MLKDFGCAFKTYEVYERYNITEALEFTKTYILEVCMTVTGFLFSLSVILKKKSRYCDHCGVCVVVAVVVFFVTNFKVITDKRW